MKKFFLLSVIIIALSVESSAQLSGPISGLLGPGSFTVTGDIIIESGETFTFNRAPNSFTGGAFSGVSTDS